MCVVWGLKSSQLPDLGCGAGLPLAPPRVTQPWGKGAGSGRLLHTVPGRCSLGVWAQGSDGKGSMSAAMSLAAS